MVLHPLLPLVQNAVPADIVGQISEVVKIVGLECPLNDVFLLVVVFEEGRLILL